MNKQDLILLGFKQDPLGLSIPLGRNRHLSISSVGESNEMVFLKELVDDTPHCSDLICLHNRDLDGPLSEAKLHNVINALSVQNSTVLNRLYMAQAGDGDYTITILAYASSTKEALSTIQSGYNEDVNEGHIFTQDELKLVSPNRNRSYVYDIFETTH